MTSSEARQYDAVVIGGGHNGIVAAAVLAKSGRKVLLVEAANELGGAARTEEFAPGFRTSLAHVLNRLHPEVIAALDLGRHGLDLSTAAMAPSVAALATTKRTSMRSTRRPASMPPAPLARKNVAVAALASETGNPCVSVKAASSTDRL